MSSIKVSVKTSGYIERYTLTKFREIFLALVPNQAEIGEEREIWRLFCIVRLNALQNYRLDFQNQGITRHFFIFSNHLEKNVVYCTMLPSSGRYLMPRNQEKMMEVIFSINLGKVDFEQSCSVKPFQNMNIKFFYWAKIMPVLVFNSFY